jgi:transposase
MEVPMARSTLQKNVQTAKYAGIDYHKKFSLVTLGDEHGEPIEQIKLYHDDVPNVTRFFKQHKGLVCALESCRGYEWFLDLLTELGLEVHVCNPVRMKIICQTAFKNDKIDSRKIMDLLARNYLPTSYQATPAERHLRERVRWRAGLVRKATSTKNAIKAILAKENISLKDPYGEKGRLQLASVPMSVTHRELLDEMLEVLDANQSAVSSQDKWIRKHAKNDYQIELLKTIPGFGDISAIAFIAEVGNLGRFKKPNQLSSYLGLVPRLSESADRSWRGGITKQGSSLMRTLLVQDAWRALSKSAELRRRYTGISRRRGKQIAIVAIARKLAEIAYCVLRDQTPFCESKLSRTE